MRIAILSDIHGNPIALDAVLADAQLLGVEAYWVLGDLVAIGHSPVEVLERLVRLDNAVLVRGNTDRYVVTGAGPRPTREEAKVDPKHVDRVVDVAASFAWTRVSFPAMGGLTGSLAYQWRRGSPCQMGQAPYLSMRPHVRTTEWGYILD